MADANETRSKKMAAELVTTYHRFISDQRYNGDHNLYAKISNLFISHSWCLNAVGGRKTFC
jgi:hypothetical protein